MADFQKRVAWLMLGFFVLAMMLTLRLGWLQLIQGKELAARAAKYHSRTVFYGYGHGSEGRGEILDRNHQPFTEANPRPGLAVFTSLGQESEDYDAWLDILIDATGLSREEIEQRSQDRWPLPLQKTLDQPLPHWIVPVDWDWGENGKFRRYTYGHLACHVLGRVGPPHADEDAPGLRVGRQGIEEAFDDLLRCPRPGVAAMVDANDRLIQGLGYRYTLAPQQQPNVVLSLDLRIQQEVEAIFDKYIQRDLVPDKGAILVMDPNSGDILAMVSRPIQGDSHYYNRATRKSNNVTMLPMASVVKVITAAAAIEQNPSLLDQRYSCSGSLTLGGNTFVCAFGPHGDQDLSQALSNSCNIYFAQLAQEVGREDLLNMAAAMGLGQPPDIDLPSVEVDAGSLPQLDDLATAGGLANHFAMGGNKMEATPLQVAVAISSIANGGYRVQPRLVLATNHDPEAQLSPPPRQRQRIMRTTTAQMVARMMHTAVSDGCASYFNHRSYPWAAENLAAKTGTSDANLSTNDYQVQWNAGFFPWRSPRYTVVYMAEVSPGQSVEREQILAEIAQRLASLD